MVVADYFILAFHQKKIEINTNLNCIIQAHKTPSSKKVLSNEHLFAQSIAGIWYSFEPIERNEGNYSAEWFDLDVSHRGQRVVLIPKYREKVLDILEHYANSSLDDYIGVLFRIEGKNKEKIVGTLTQQQFRRLLIENKLKYNCMYIVKK